ncbi:hypothetical protein ES703_41360 [subsurface metagenome]
MSKVRNEDALIQFYGRRGILGVQVVLHGLWELRDRSKAKVPTLTRRIKPPTPGLRGLLRLTD